MKEKKAPGKPKFISVVLTAEANHRLSDVARKAGRSRQLEAMLRIHDHLNKFPEMNGDNREIIKMTENSER
ncbi:TraY domain-containing protein [Entomohabitans teleogrylli]|uniref:TraY domain-containing protein n=1 Tax=Entomohabitans teleogrylli TaxID=1384589 RepID=UPI00073D38DC|nr:TraY domain-containing protein [Entomohabitans teleogrylli]